jgi:UDP-glucose 4-epimerase
MLVDRMEKPVLITGGAGFIGSHLAELLFAQGKQVIVLDDLSTGRIENLSGLMGKSGFEFVRDTVENDSTINLITSQCSQVYHLASAVGVQLIVDEPVRTIRTIIGGTQTVLEAAHKFGKPVLITSSSEVYGKGARVPFHEDDDVVMGSTRHSRWCYAYAKGIDEFLGLAYHKQFGLPVTVVRLFNTVGPRQLGQYGMVLPRFVESAKKNVPLNVFGDGSQTRCFCHVSDVAAALSSLMDHPTAAGEVFNVGSDEEISILDLAKKVISLTGSSSNITHMTYEQAYGQSFDDMPRRVPSLQKINKWIGFRPSKNLEAIIRSVSSSS